MTPPSDKPPATPAKSGARNERVQSSPTATQRDRSTAIPYDLVIEIKNEPGALARVTAAISDAGVNLAAATCIGTAAEVELHILVPHAEPVKRALAISQLAVSREREVVVIEVEDRPGVLADLTRKVARAGIDLDLVYIATRNRIVFGAADLDGLKATLDLSA
jgi:hypothetical protein